MPMGLPSASTTLTSFALISSLINNSFALIRNTPPKIAIWQKKSCEESIPARHKSSRTKSERKNINRTRLCGTVRTEIVLLHFPMYSITTSFRCQAFFEKFLRNFKRDLKSPSRRLLSLLKKRFLKIFIFHSFPPYPTTEPTTSIFPFVLSAKIFKKILIFF